MKTLFKSVLIIMLLQACTSSKYLNSEFRDNRALYHIFPYSLGDSRNNDEDPDILCRLDKYTLDQLAEEINVFSPAGYFKDAAKKPILNTSFKEIASPEIEAYLEKQNDRGARFVKLFVNISCIGLEEDELKVTVTGEINQDIELLWKNTVTITTTVPDLSISAKEWNNLICQAIRMAVKDCLNSIPK
jgi:hypothetical protein